MHHLVSHTDFVPSSRKIRSKLALCIVVVGFAACSTGEKSKLDAKPILWGPSSSQSPADVGGTVAMGANNSKVSTLEPIHHTEGDKQPLTKVPTVAQCTGQSLPSARYWRLLPSQVAYSLQDIFGGENIPTLDGLEVNRFKEQFANDPMRLDLTLDTTSRLTAGVDAVSNWIVQNVAAVKTCSSTASDSCLSDLLAMYAPLFWRGPVSSEDLAAVLALATQAKSQGATLAERTQIIFEALLLSPRFLYRSEIGIADANGGKQRKLTPYEVASELSYSVWQSTPDQILIALAAAEKLQTPAEIAEQLARMNKDPKAKRGVQNLFDMWLGLADVESTPKDPSYSVDFTAAIRKDMRSEAILFLDDFIWTKNASISEIFSTQETYLTPQLAAFYGVPAPPGPGFSKVVVDAKKRAGLLSSGAFIAPFSNNRGTGLTHRADFALKHLLCAPLPPPPPGIFNATDGAVGDVEMTTRQRFEKLHSTQASCAGCHRTLDPVGGAFESWDSIGKFRIKEGNLPIDSSGNLILGGKSEITFANGVEFLQKLSVSERFSACFAIKTYQATFGVVPSVNSSCEVAKVYESLQKTDLKPSLLFPALAVAESFLFREVRSDK